MSKETFNYHVYNIDIEGACNNTLKDIGKLLKTLKKKLGVCLEDCLFCFEHTGMYSYHMMQKLGEFNLSFSMISGLDMRNSLGIQRGKNDIVDARRIAEYAFLRQHKLKLTSLPSKDLFKLKKLLSIRALHVKKRASYISRLKEEKRIFKKSEFHFIFKTQEKIIKVISKAIDETEKEIHKLIQASPKIKKYFDLITSIKGIGLVLGASIIVKTGCFTLFDDWRKFACYCGTAPFPNQSGKSFKKHRISKIGDTKLKTNLTLGARSAVLHDPELKLYQQKRLNEGVEKKKIYNMIRNKLLARVFSVAKRQTPYVVLHTHAK